MPASAEVRNRYQEIVDQLRPLLNTPKPRPAEIEAQIRRLESERVKLVGERFS